MYWPQKRGIHIGLGIDPGIPAKYQIIGVVVRITTSLPAKSAIKETTR